MPTPDEFYTDTQRKLQIENDSAALGSAVVAAIVSEELKEEQVEFISAKDFFFLSTVNSKGEPTVSYKGGGVGLVKVINSKKVMFPNYDGNGMFYSMGNIEEMNKVGLLFIDFETPNRLRIQGTASISKELELLAQYPGANMVVVVDIDSVFVNCARYIHQHSRVETSKYVPDESGKQPFPAWKRLDKIQAALPSQDQGRAESEGGLITDHDYQTLLEEGNS